MTAGGVDAEDGIAGRPHTQTLAHSKTGRMLTDQGMKGMTAAHSNACS